MKKNKLYTANKWNRPAFMPEKNLFSGTVPGQSSQMQIGGISPDILGGYKTTAPGTYPKVDWSNPVQRAAALGTTAGLVNGFSDIANQFNPFEKAGSAGGSGTFSAGTLGGDLLNMGAGVFGGLAKNAISGGLSSGAGEAVGNLGSTVGGMVGKVNPIAGAAVTFGSNVVGGAINAAFGTAVDQEKLNKAKEGTAALNNFRSEANTFAGIQGPMSQENVQDAYRGGWFSSSDAEKKNAELRYLREEAKNQAYLQVANNARNIADDQLGNALANYASLGGSLNRNKKGNKMNRMTLMPAINTFGHGGCFNPFALGGDVQMHGADFTNGLIVPSDNTRVFKPMMLPVQRQQNFSDSEYFWDAGKEYPAGLWKHKDGTFHTTGSYGKDIVLTQEEADSIIRANKAKNRREKLRKAMENHKQNTYANGGQMYSVGQTYDVSEEEANRLKAMGYEFTVVS